MGDCGGGGCDCGGAGCGDCGNCGNCDCGNCGHCDGCNCNGACNGDCGNACNSSGGSCNRCCDASRCDTRCCFVSAFIFLLIPGIAALVTGICTALVLDTAIVNRYPTIRYIPFFFVGIFALAVFCLCCAWSSYERSPRSRLADDDICCRSCDKGCERCDCDFRCCHITWITLALIVVGVTSIVGLGIVFTSRPETNNFIPFMIAGCAGILTLLLCANWSRYEYVKPSGVYAAEESCCNCGTCEGSCDQCCDGNACDSRCCYANATVFLLIFALVAFVVGMCTALAVNSAVVNAQPFLRYLPFIVSAFFFACFYMNISAWSRYERSPRSKSRNDLCCRSCTRCCNQSQCDSRCCHVTGLILLVIPTFILIIVGICLIYTLQPAGGNYVPFIIGGIFAGFMWLICLSWWNYEKRIGHFGDDYAGAAQAMPTSNAVINVQPTFQQPVPQQSPYAAQPYAPAQPQPQASPYAAQPYVAPAPAPAAGNPYTQQRVPPTQPYQSAPAPYNPAVVAPPPTNPYAVAAAPEGELPPSYEAALSPVPAARTSYTPAPAPAPAPTGPVPGAAVPATAGQSCQQCHAAMQPGARFCVMCGATYVAPAAPPSCRACKAQLPAGARFCAMCGTSNA